MAGPRDLSRGIDFGPPPTTIGETFPNAVQGGGGGGTLQSTVQAVAQSAAASAAAGVGSAVAAQSQQESSRAISAFTQTSVKSNEDLIKEFRVLIEEVRKLATADEMRNVFREGSQFQAGI